LCVKVCESKSVMRVGPVSVWVHVRNGVTDYVCYGMTVYIHFFTKKNLYKKKLKKYIYVCPSSKSVMRVGPVSV
jgi:hypothetical protein